MYRFLKDRLPSELIDMIMDYLGNFSNDVDALESACCLHCRICGVCFAFFFLQVVVCAHILVVLGVCLFMIISNHLP
ncbi:hypothetical protein EBZ80_20515 [bacterium]|nr:hypothetical protein [bacterium]